MCKNVMLSLLVSFVLVVGSAQATVVFSDDFEAYTAGAVMPVRPAALPPVGYGWGDVVTPNNDVIATDIVKSGQQSLKMMRSGTNIAQVVAMGTSGTLAGGIDLTISQDVYLPWWNGTFGGSCENYFGSPAKSGWSINGSAKIAYYQNGVATPTAVGAERNAWNNYTMVFHLVSLGGTKFDGTWDFSVKNAAGTTYITQTGLTIGQFDLGDLFPRLYMYAGSTWSSNVVYYDNISMTVVPEPATMSILGLGLLGLLRRKK